MRAPTLQIKTPACPYSLLRGCSPLVHDSMSSPSGRTRGSSMHAPGDTKEVPPSLISKKRSRSAVDIRDSCHGHGRPRNVKDLSQWLQKVLQNDNIGRNEQELPEFLSLSLLLDPDFAYVWTPACTVEFRDLILASGVTFEEHHVESAVREMKFPMTRLPKDAAESQSEGVHSLHRTGQSTSRSSSLDVVDLNSDDGHYSQCM